MTDAETIDTNLKVVYIDPLIESNITDYKSTKHRQEVIEGDENMHSYIQKLDEEIYSDSPFFEPEEADVNWIEEDLGDMATQLMDQARTHGWAVVQFYASGDPWRIFSPSDFVKWIYKDGKDTEEIIGAEFTLSRATTNQFCVWDYKQCYLLKWKQGDYKEVFAYPDMSKALWTNITITRQIQNQLDMMARSPEFPWVTYGTGVTVPQRTAILNALDDASVTNGVGTSKNVVEDIKFIARASYVSLLEVLEYKTRKFAGLTRLPLAFYNGERESAGLGEKGELIVEMKIDKKKQHIFNKLKPILVKLYQDRYKITLTSIEMDMNEVELEPETQETQTIETDATQEDEEENE